MHYLFQQFRGSGYAKGVVWRDQASGRPLSTPLTPHQQPIVVLRWEAQRDPEPSKNHDPGLIHTGGGHRHSYVCSGRIMARQSWVINSSTWNTFSHSKPELCYVCVYGDNTPLVTRDLCYTQLFFNPRIISLSVSEVSRKLFAVLVLSESRLLGLTVLIFPDPASPGTPCIPLFLIIPCHHWADFKNDNWSNLEFNALATWLFNFPVMLTQFMLGMRVLVTN